MLDKKYALPYRVLDALVAHFMRFLDDSRIMPVIWHQSLLAFVQRSASESFFMSEGLCASIFCMDLTFFVLLLPFYVLPQVQERAEEGGQGQPQNPTGKAEALFSKNHIALGCQIYLACFN